MLYNGHAIKMTKCIQDIKSGIEYIYSLGLVHCDIKPENIFVDLQNHGFAVGDFDSVHCEGVALTLKTGTAGWVPEEADTSNTAGFDIDWYSLAMIQSWSEIKMSGGRESEDAWAHTTNILDRKRKEIMPVSGTVAASDQNQDKGEKENEDEDEMDTSW